MLTGRNPSIVPDERARSYLHGHGRAGCDPEISSCARLSQRYNPLPIGARVSPGVSVRPNQRRPFSLRYAIAVAVLLGSLAMPGEASERSRGPEPAAVPVAPSTTMVEAGMRQEPVVALTYYFALFLVGPYGCLDFMTDGTIIGTQPSYSGTCRSALAFYLPP